jgi:hypothetical protein
LRIYAPHKARSVARKRGIFLFRHYLLTLGRSIRCKSTCAISRLWPACSSIATAHSWTWHALAGFGPSARPMILARPGTHLGQARDASWTSP